LFRHLVYSPLRGGRRRKGRKMARPRARARTRNGSVSPLTSAAKPFASFGLFWRRFLGWRHVNSPALGGRVVLREHRCPEDTCLQVSYPLMTTCSAIKNDITILYRNAAAVAVGRRGELSAPFYGWVVTFDGMGGRMTVCLSRVFTNLKPIQGPYRLRERFGVVNTRIAAPLGRRRRNDYTP